MRIKRSWLIFSAFWLLGGIIATIDKDIFLGLMFGILGVIAFK